MLEGIMNILISDQVFALNNITSDKWISPNNISPSHYKTLL